MKTKISLTTKITSAMVAVLLCVLTGLMLFNLSELRGLAKQKGEGDAELAAEQFSSQLNRKLLQYTDEAGLLKEILLQARISDAKAGERLDASVKKLMDRQKDIYGVFSIWEKEAFAGEDAIFANSAESRIHNGKIVSYTVRKDDSFMKGSFAGQEIHEKGDYYFLAQKQLLTIVPEPYSYSLKGKLVQMLSIIMPVADDSGLFLGVIGIEIPLETFQNLTLNNNPEDGYASVLSNGGYYLASSMQPERMMDFYGDTPDKRKMYDRTHASDKRAISGYVQHKMLDGSVEQVYTILAPVTIEGSSQRLYVETLIPENKILQSYNKHQVSIWSATAIALLMMAVLSILLVRLLIIKKLHHISGIVERLAEKDFTVIMPVKRKDELGKLAKNINSMTEQIRFVLHRMSELIVAVGATSEQLSASADQTAQAAGSIATIAEKSAYGSEREKQYVTETVDSIKEMSIGIERIAASSETVSEFVHKVRESTEHGNSRMLTAKQKIGVVRKTVEDAELAFEHLNEQSQAINGIAGIISRISSQTNMLALNANIEAARAGVHGKGFAVVATEVRKLADQTKKAAGEIAHIVRQIQEESENVAGKLLLGSKEVRDGELYIIESANIFKEVKKNMFEAGNQISEISVSAEQLNAGVQQIRAASEELVEMANESAGRAEGAAAATEEQLASMQEITEASVSLADMVQTLMEKIKKFKID